MSAPESATVADVERAPRRALATVFAVVVIDLLGFGIVIPILPFYVRSFGVSDVFIGVLAASYSLMQFVFAPYLGQLSDTRGRRPVLLLSLAGSAVSWVVFGLATEIGAAAGTAAGLAVLFVSRMTAGAMGGNIAAAQAYIADVTPPERRAGALGLIGAAFGLGFVFGPALGGVLASDGVVAAARSALPAAVPVTRFSLPSFGAAALSLLSLAFASAFLVESSTTRSPTDRVGFVEQFRTALADAGLRPYVIAFFVTSVAFAGIQVMFIPFAADAYGYDATQTALLLTYIGGLSVLNQGVLVGALSRRYRDRSIALAGAAVLIVGFLGVAFAPSAGAAALPSVPGPAFLTPGLVALLVALALLSVGNSLLNVALSTLVSRAASAETQGTAFGVTQGAGSLGRTVGPPAMAALYAAVAIWSPFVVGALLTVVVLAVLAGVGGRRGG